MLNEGIIVNDTRSLIKTEMIKQLWNQKRTDPKTWQKSVFEAVTRANHDDIDWKFEDNQAGYYTWIRAFDQLVSELIDDGYVKVEEQNGRKTMVATDVDPNMGFSQVVYPPRG